MPGSDAVPTAIPSVPDATALASLRATYAARLTPSLASNQGGVGLVGNTIPRELVAASGRPSVLVSPPLGTPTPHADRYLEPVIPPETRALLEVALDGQLAGFDLLILSRPYAQLYYYLKELYRWGRAPGLPPLYMFDLMQSQRPAVETYNRQQLEALRSRLARLRGQAIAEADLRASIATADRVRALQRTLNERRWQAEVLGTTALEVIGAGYVSDPATYAAALETYLAELRPEPTLARRPRLVVLPSEPLAHPGLHTALEAAGALVVAEDDWWGARAPGADVPATDPALEGLLHKYWRDTPTTHVTPAAAREAWFVEHALRPEVAGVVFYLPPADHQLGWDYPRLKAWLDAHGKPSLLIRQDAARPTEQAAITGAVATWLRRDA